MQLIYLGDTICPFQTIKRLFCFAEAIHFLDLPCIDRGGIRYPGRPSEIRRIDTDARTVKIDALDPTQCGVNSDLLIEGVVADLASENLKVALVEGLAQSKSFRAWASRALQARFADSVALDSALISILQCDRATLLRSMAPPQAPLLLDHAQSLRSPAEVASALLIDVSLHMTSALRVAQISGAVLATDDAWFLKLMALRGPTGSADGLWSSQQKLLIGRAPLGDKLLEESTLGDVDLFRGAVVDTYRQWLTTLGAGVTQVAKAARAGVGAASIQSTVAKLRKELDRDESKLAKERDSYFKLTQEAGEAGARPCLELLAPALAAVVGLDAGSNESDFVASPVSCLFVDTCPNGV